jgi:hypothetical protein
MAIKSKVLSVLKRTSIADRGMHRIRRLLE